ncbi:hypothetical protein Tco_1409386 [Tanacetum coccineum]
MERGIRNNDEMAQKLLDVVKDLDKGLTKRQAIIVELKIKKGMGALKAVTFFRKLELCELEMRHQLMMQINETQLCTFEKKEFVKAMKKL